MIAPSITSSTHLCDRQAIIDAVRLIVPPGGVTELRALDANTDGRDWVGTYSGYFDDPEKLADAACGLRVAQCIWITLNPVNPALLARACNRLKRAGKGSSTQNSDITARRWMFIDVDVDRPTGISATDEEVHLAIVRAQEIDLWLHDQGWPDPLSATSGNGAHRLYRIDQPTA